MPILLTRKLRLREVVSCWRPHSYSREGACLWPSRCCLLSQKCSQKNLGCLEPGALGSGGGGGGRGDLGAAHGGAAACVPESLSEVTSSLPDLLPPVNPHGGTQGSTFRVCAHLQFLPGEKGHFMSKKGTCLRSLRPPENLMGARTTEVLRKCTLTTVADGISRMNSWAPHGGSSRRSRDRQAEGTFVPHPAQL